MANFVQTFQQQSWYPQVESVMQQYGIPDYMWEGVVQAESGGNPKSFNPNDPDGGSYGLFQINGVHGNAANWTIAQQATWAAQQLAPVARTLPSNATPAQVTVATENAAWPGSAKSTVGLKEYPERLAAFEAAMSGNSQGGAQFTGNSNSVAQPTLSSPLANIGTSLDNWTRGGSFSSSGDAPPPPAQTNWWVGIEQYLTSAGWFVLTLFIATLVIIIGVILAR